jgi:simple sugar transport system permease protein
MPRSSGGALVGTVVVFVFFAIFAGSNHFVTLNGTASWADQAAELGIVAVPVGLLMIGGEFDLSIAAVIGMSAVVVSIGTGTEHWPLVISIALALAVAVLVGLINGMVTVHTGLPSFIVTLASYFSLTGATLFASFVIASNSYQTVTVTGFFHSVFAGSVHQFNASLIWCFLVVIAAGYVLSYTVFGNWVMATGGDRTAAVTVGVPVNRVKVTLFVTTALGAALLGIIQAIEYGGGQVGQGEGFIFEAIIAATIGGVLLQGGYGSALGVMLGAATYSIVSVGVYYTGWNSNLAQLFIGLLVLVAVLANNFLRRLALSE